MKKWKDFLILLLSFICGTALTYLVKLFNGVERIIFIISVIITVILIVIIVYQKVKESRTTRFAVIVFLLNEKNELALVYNQTHKILLPPCKTMRSNEVPHKAVERILKTQMELEVKDYEIDITFHKLNGKYYRVLDCYTPYATQQEFVTKQSKSVRYHYSLIYVYRLKKYVNINRNTKYFPQFYSLDEINNIEEKIKPFQDIIQRYSNILEQINCINDKR